VRTGNAGTACERELNNVALTSIADLVAFAQRERVGLTVVGPEGPLADGSGGRIPARRPQDLRSDPGCGAARELEDFAKSFMARHRIPTART
jgi:phosphoribosylamine--glycine ligase